MDGKRGRPRLSRITIEHLERVTTAVEMRRDYKTWEEIATACGYANRSTARTAVKREMDERRAALGEGIDELRDQELQRLDHLGAKALEVLNAIHFTMSAGQVVERDGVPVLDDGPVLSAIDRLLKISESRRRLLGLDMPAKIDASVSVAYSIEGISPEELP